MTCGSYERPQLTAGKKLGHWSYNDKERDSTNTLRDLEVDFSWLNVGWTRSRASRESPRRTQPGLAQTPAVRTGRHSAPLEARALWYLCLSHRETEPRGEV